MDYRFERIYELLRHRLRPGIMVYDMYQFEMEFLTEPVPRRIRAIAIPELNILVFRYIPPDVRVFTHELIHLCRKPEADRIPEEIWAWNLVEIVLYAVEENIKADPLKLFTLSEEQVNSVLRRYHFENIEEFYNTLGIIPVSHTVRVEDGRMVAIRRPEYPWTNVLVVFIAELGGGLSWCGYCRMIIKDLLLEYCSVDEKESYYEY